MTCQRGGRLDDVLAIVQDQHLIAVAERGGQPVQRARSGFGGAAGNDRFTDAQRVQHRVRHLGRFGHRLQRHEPRRRAQPSRGLNSQPGLADTARAGERDQTGRAQVLQHPGQVLVAADETGQGALRPGGGGPCLGRHRGPFGIGRGLFPAPQDAEIDLLEQGGRVHPELVGEQFTTLVVRGDRLGLASGGVQRAHELSAGRSASGSAESSTRSSPTRLAPSPRVRSASIRSARTLERSSVSLAAVARRSPIRRHRLVAGPARRAARPAGPARPAPRRRRPAHGGPARPVPRRPSRRPLLAARPAVRRVRLDHVARPGLAQFGPQPGNQSLQGVAGVSGGSSGQSSPANEPAGTTRPAFSASKVSKTRNWRPPTWTGRPVSSRT